MFIGEVVLMYFNGGIVWEGDFMFLFWWGGSVVEVIFLISIERNGDKIIGVIYVFGFCSLDCW